MPITIPTSLGRVSILPGGISGPLAKLFGNKFDSNAYYYPLDLNSDTAKRHYIKFDIYEILPGKPGTALVNGVKTSMQGITSTNGILENIKSGGTSLATGVGNAVQEISAINPTYKVKKSLYLNIPDTVNVSYAAGYDDVSLVGALGKPYFLAQVGASMYDKIGRAHV